MNRCLIVSGGEFSPIEKNEKYDFIIACDRGYEYCKKMKLRPDIIIGDLDSYEGEIEKGIPLIKLNPIKDDTDTISGVRYALDKGYKNIEICCAFGGRFDHSLANVQTALFIREHGAKAVIRGSKTKLTVIKNEEIHLKKEEDYYLSVFSMTEYSRGVTIKGTKYSLENAEIKYSYPIGTSNEWESDEAYIKVEEGSLLIVASKQDR